MSNECVLFAPVGSTDPVRNSHDGPIMHIVRHYRDKGLRKVYLFLTAEMEQKKVDTYLERGIRRLVPACEISRIFSKIEDPSNFSLFRDHYLDALNTIQKDHPGAAILLNVSSGTPQMIAALCMIACMGEFPSALPVQVKTPIKESNYWAVPDEHEMDKNEDDLEKAESRCLEPDLNSFRKAFVVEQIKAALKSYNYLGAYSLSRSNKNLLAGDTKNLLAHLYFRLLPNEEKACNQANALDIEKLAYPVRDCKARSSLEYYLKTRIMQRRGEIGDFLVRTFVLLEKCTYDFLIKKHYTIPKNEYGHTNMYLLTETIKNKLPNEVALLNELVKIEAVRPIRNSVAHYPDPKLEEDIKKAMPSGSPALLKALESILKIVYSDKIKDEHFNILENLNECTIRGLA